VATETLIIENVIRGAQKVDAYGRSLGKVDAEAEKLQGTTRDLNGRLRDAKGGFIGAGNAASQSSKGFNKAALALRRVAVGYLTVTAAQKAMQTGIQRAESERRIQFLAQGYGEAKDLATAASKAAQRFGQSQTEANRALATAYARLRPVGTSLKDIESVYTGFNTAARISGASAVEASNAFTQLAQALGSGALRGDEFNSISEQVPAILTAIAAETGVAQGQLRKYAAEGKITADVVIAALKRIEKDGADQLAAAMNGPAQKTRDLQIAFEELMVALTETIVPEMAEAFGTLGEIIYALETPIKYIGEQIGWLLAKTNQAIREINSLARAAISPGKISAAADVREGKKPWNIQGAEELFEGTGPNGGGLRELREQARVYAKLRGEEVAKVEQRMMLDRLNSIQSQVVIPARPESTPTPTSAMGGGKTSKGGGQATTNRVPQLQAELALQQQLFLLEVQSNQAELNSDKKLAAELELKKNLLEIEAEIAKVQAGTGTEAEKLVQTAMLQIQAEKEKLDAAHSIAIEEKERVESYKDLMEGMDREIELLEEKDGWARELLKIQQEILDLQKEGLLVTQEEIDAYKKKREEKAEAEGKKGNKKIKDYMKQLEAELKDTEGMIVSLAQTVETELSSAMSTAITSVITGTGTVEEAFSQMFANIGKAFIDMATQMIAKALIMKALGIVMGGAGGGGSITAGQVGAAHSAGTITGPLPFAEGGFVTGPTNAVIGEGAQPEYVIPESKMAAAMENYSAGARGDQVLGGNDSAGGGEGGSVVYSPSFETVSIGGQSYVTTEQMNQAMEQGMAAAAKRGAAMGKTQIYSEFRNNRSTRQRLAL